MAENLSLEHSSAIADFRDMLAKYTKKAACGRNYVLVEKLKLWLENKAEAYDRTQASRLLDFAYRQRSRHRPAYPIRKEELCDSHDGCLLVFCILLELGKGHLIDEFRRQDICDKHLPINLYSLREKTGTINTRNSSALADDFNRFQWQFCPAKFEMGLGKSLHPDHVLPFCKKEQINNKGGTAQLWQVEVPGEFVSQNIAQAIAKAAGYDNKNDNLGLRYNFAIKTFVDGKKYLFENEKEAFRALSDQPGMVRYLGDFEHVEYQRSVSQSDATPIKTITSNIILEFGEYDLDEYFLEFAPPIFQNEITSFWEGLFDVAYAVRGIHHLKVDREGQTKEFYGWHADIKPDNILIVQGRFKLADPGFATFLKKTETEPMKVISGGTETYSAPERRYSRSGKKEVAVSPTIDIWSLGCVFSIAATWVVLGREGMLQFTELRKRSIRKIVEGQPQHPTGAYLNHDCFHNGHGVLPDVLSWHACLRSVLRKSDIVTGSVLDLIDKYMLIGDASRRIKAKDLCDRLNEMKSQMQAEAPALPQNIMETLIVVDEASPRLVMTRTTQEPTELEKSSTIVDKRQAQKSALLGVPSKMTAGRSEILRSELGSSYVNIRRDDELPEISLNVPSLQTPVIQNTNDLPPLLIQENPIQENIIQGNSWFQGGLEVVETPLDPRYAVVGPFAMTKQRAGSRKRRVNPPQDVFQARQEIESRPKANRFSRKTAKDELLSRHFSNRDIKFLIDNAESMDSYWYCAKYLLETLLLKATGQDDNGMDLSFTSGNVCVRNSNDASKFIKAMDDSNAKPSLHIHTDMRRSLGEIFHRYLSDARKREIKNLTVIIFTDGIWDGMDDKNGVDDKIITFTNQLRRIVGNLKDRPVSIEFVQFGKDPDATSRLRRLDDDLVYSGIPDIVDSEHCSGDVNKMLLGSFVEEYDLIDDDESTHMSPIVGPGHLTESPYQQPTGYFPTSSTAETSLFPLPTRFSTVPQVRRDTLTGGLQREQSTRSTAVLQREQSTRSTAGLHREQSTRSSRYNH